jgi:hypothetical protein
MTKFYNNFYFYIELGEIFQEMVQEWYQIVDQHQEEAERTSQELGQGGATQCRPIRSPALRPLHVQYCVCSRIRIKVPLNTNAGLKR